MNGLGGKGFAETSGGKTVYGVRLLTLHQFKKTEEMKEIRVINRVVIALCLFGGFLALCAEFETMSLTQFAVAKVMAAVWCFAWWKLGKFLSDENLI